MIDPVDLINNPYKVKTRNELIGIWMIVLLAQHRTIDGGSTEDYIEALQKQVHLYSNDTLIVVIKNTAPRIYQMLQFDDGLYTFGPPHTTNGILETAPQ